MNERYLIMIRIICLRFIFKNYLKSELFQSWWIKLVDCEAEKLFERGHQGGGGGGGARFE